MVMSTFSVVKESDFDVTLNVLFDDYAHCDSVVERLNNKTGRTGNLSSLEMEVLELMYDARKSIGDVIKYYVGAQEFSTKYNEWLTDRAKLSGANA